MDCASSESIRALEFEFGWPSYLDSVGSFLAHAARQKVCAKKSCLGLHALALVSMLRLQAVVSVASVRSDHAVLATFGLDQNISGTGNETKNHSLDLSVEPGWLSIVVNESKTGDMLRMAARQLLSSYRPTDSNSLADRRTAGRSALALWLACCEALEQAANGSGGDGGDTPAQGSNRAHGNAMLAAAQAPPLASKGEWEARRPAPVGSLRRRSSVPLPLQLAVGSLAVASAGPSGAAASSASSSSSSSSSGAGAGAHGAGSFEYTQALPATGASHRSRGTPDRAHATAGGTAG